MTLNIEDINACPHCGSDVGFYQTMYLSGWSYESYYFERAMSGDRLPNNGDMYDSIDSSRHGKWYYCLECKKRICKVKE